MRQFVFVMDEPLSRAIMYRGKLSHNISILSFIAGNITIALASHISNTDDKGKPSN